MANVPGWSMLAVDACLGIVVVEVVVCGPDFEKAFRDARDGYEQKAGSRGYQPIPADHVPKDTLKR